MNITTESEYVPPPVSKAKKPKLTVPDYSEEGRKYGVGTSGGGTLFPSEAGTSAGMKTTVVSKTPFLDALLAKRKAKQQEIAKERETAEKDVVSGTGTNDEDANKPTEPKMSFPPVQMKAVEPVPFLEKCQSVICPDWNGKWPSYHKSSHRVLHMAKVKRKCFM